MDYKKMWEKLKEEIISKKEYHKSGMMQSMMESIHGESFCEELLKMMSQIEEEEKSAE